MLLNKRTFGPNVCIARTAWRKSPNHNYSFQRESSEFYSKMLLLSVLLYINDWKIWWVQCSRLSVTPRESNSGVFCCILWDLLYLVIRKCLCVVQTYFCVLTKTKTKYSKKLIKSNIKPKNLGLFKETFILLFSVNSANCCDTTKNNSN